MFDEMTITILKDGTIKTVADAISPANHDNAESFIKGMARLAGGETVRAPRTDVKHSHTHDDVSEGHHHHH